MRAQWLRVQGINVEWLNALFGLALALLIGIAGCGPGSVKVDPSDTPSEQQIEETFVEDSTQAPQEEEKDASEEAPAGSDEETDEEEKSSD